MKLTRAHRRLVQGPVIATMTFVLAAAVLTGCTKGDTSPTSPDAGATAPVASGEICATYTGKKIGVVHLTVADENEGTLVSALKEAADSAGLDWEFLEADSQGDPGKSQQAVSSFINQGVDAIILMVVNARDVQAELTQAKEAGIPVFGQWSFSELNPLIVSDYTSLPAADASALAGYMFSNLYLENPEGDIEIALVNSNADIFAPRNAAVRGLAEIYPRIKIVDSADIDFTDVTGSTTRIVDGFISKHPNLKAVWTIYPVSGPAAAQAVLASREDIEVYTHIAQSEGIKALADPDNPIVAMPWVDFDRESYGTVESILNSFAGNEANRLASYENVVPFKLFTKETANQLDGVGVASGIGWTLFGGQWKQGLVDEWGTKFTC